MPRAKSSKSPLGIVLAIIVALGGGSGIAGLLGREKTGRDLPRSQRHAVPSLNSDQQQAEPVGSPIEFTLYDRLERNQVSKYLSVAVDGKSAGTMTLDSAHPSGTLKIGVPKAGAHSYSIEGVLTVRSLFGRQRQFKGAGRAAIDVSQGQTFEPRVDLQGNDAHFSLQPVIGAMEK